MRDGIRVAVDGMELQSRLPGTMLDDWEMDEWLRDSGPQRAAEATAGCARAGLSNTLEIVSPRGSSAGRDPAEAEELC